MTERTLKVSMTANMAAAICAYVEDQLNQEPDAETINHLQNMDDQATEVLRGLNLMEKATKLYEDDRIALFEHPDKGDEVPLMAYFKGTEHFDENTGEYDADPHTVEIIMEDHRQYLKTLS